MLDIHSHFLPKMDDGSKNTEMSMEMLRRSKRQGVTTIVSTSHFYGNHEAPENFLRRRRHAFEKLTPLLGSDTPQIYLGAEVLYFPGIAQSEEVRRLAIEGTDLILIEMPFVPWSEKIFDELNALQYNSGLHIVLAHVERYQAIQKRDLYNGLFDLPVYFQCNAEAFSSLRSRKLALSLIERDMLHFLGSDCHNTDKRPPNIQEAQAVIEKKLSRSAWRNFSKECEERFERHIL